MIVAWFVIADNCYWYFTLNETADFFSDDTPETTVESNEVNDLENVEVDVDMSYEGQTE